MTFNMWYLTKNEKFYKNDKWILNNSKNLENDKCQNEGEEDMWQNHFYLLGQINSSN